MQRSRAFDEEEVVDQRTVGPERLGPDAGGGRDEILGADLGDQLLERYAVNRLRLNDRIISSIPVRQCLAARRRNPG